MALELPGYAVPAFDQVGLPWPGIDEDQLRAWGASVRAFAGAMRESASRTRQSVAGLADSSRSSFTVALDARCGERGRLVDDLGGQLDDFADALDAAAAAAEAQKQVVIDAATTLAAELNVGPSAPVAPGAGQPTREQEISVAGQTVGAALGSLEAELSVQLAGIAATQVSDDVNRFLASLRDDAMPAVGDVHALRLSYESLRETSSAIRRDASETGRKGEAAYARNASRDLRESSAGTGHPVGDGGRWQAVLQTVEQALGDAAVLVFTTTSAAIAEDQRSTASALDAFAGDILSADGRAGQDHPTRRSSQLAFKISEVAGEKAATELQGGTITFAQFLKLLKAHEDDPGFQTGAMRVVSSPRGRMALYPLIEAYEGRGENLRPLALAVIAAMAHGVTFPGLPAQWQPEDDEVLAPLLLYANFPPKLLTTLGREELTSGDSPWTHWVWSALAKNPAAAAMFIQQYAPDIVNYLSSYTLAPQGEDANQFLAVLRAGTLGLKSTDPTRSAKAVSALAQAYYNDQNAHASSQFEALYGEIIKAYWRDLNYAVTNPSTLAGESPDGLRLTRERWAPFVDEAMRNPSTAAMVVARAHAQGYQYFKMQGQQPVNPNDPYEYARNAGSVDGYFDYQALTVYNQLNAENANPNSWRATLVNDLALAAIWASPGPEVSIPASLGADVVLPMIDQLLDTRPGTLRPPPPSLSGLNEEIAVAYYNEATAGGMASSPALQAVVSSANAANTAAEKSEAASIKAGTPPTEAPFLVDGKIPSLSSMSPPQQAAFINWLNSAANQFEPPLTAAQAAYLSAAAPESQPGG